MEEIAERPFQASLLLAPNHSNLFWPKLLPLLKIISLLKNKEASGADSIPYEILKHSDKTTIALSISGKK